MEHNIAIGGLILGIISGGYCGLLLANLYDGTSLFKKIKIIFITIISILIFSIICCFCLKSAMNV